MKLVRALCLAAGLALCAWIAAESDLGAVAELLGRLGLAAVAIVLAVYALDFLFDVAAWPS